MYIYIYNEEGMYVQFPHFEGTNPFALTFSFKFTPDTRTWIGWGSKVETGPDISFCWKFIYLTYFIIDSVLTYGIGMYKQRMP